MLWVISKTSCDGIGNVMKGFLSALAVNPDTKIQCNPTYRLGQYDTVLDPTHIYTTGEYEPFYTCRLLVLREEEEEQCNIVNEFPYTNGCGNPKLNHHYSMSTKIDWNYDTMKLCPRVRDRILRTIQTIRFQPRILDDIEVYISHFKPGTSLGISVRTWKAPHEHNIDRPYSFETYMDAIRPHIPSVSTIVLSVDNEDVISEYVNALQHDNVIVLRQKENENPTQHSFIKMLTLARCDIFIGNRISTFSELVFWFSGCKSRVMTVY